MKSLPIHTFAEQARAFCGWATGLDESEMTAASALARVCSLYVAALSLPHPWSEGLAGKLAEAEPASGGTQLKTGRVSQLPFQVYWEVFDPLNNPPGEPVAGDIVDDIGDIYRDVARGLVLYEAGRENEALWEWGFNFRIHWGEHATGAIRALHAFLSQENPDG